jgi:hypothetical protein
MNFLGHLVDVRCDLVHIGGDLVRRRPDIVDGCGARRPRRPEFARG